VPVAPSQGSLLAGPFFIPLSPFQECVMLSIAVPLSTLLVVLVLGVIALLRAPSADIVEIVRTILRRADGR
jgi:hypothetical protein